MAILRRPRRATRSVSLFYASDVHGSRVCWRKFVNAGRHYGVDALLMGGDLCGKGLVPVVEQDGGWVATVAGDERRAVGERELDELERAIRLNGFYPWRATPAELARLRADAALAEATFERVMLDELAEWMAFADERLGADGPPAYVMAGNDDPWSVDEVVRGAAHVIHCDERVVDLLGYELLSFGWANRTPWDTARELDEDELYRRLRALCDRLERPGEAILNLHVPPYDSGLDTAVELDATLAPVYRGGRPHEVPVGSTAVRQIIEEVQPALSLHGHIHESRGITKIGATVAINPGSDYGAGRIEGCVVELQDGAIRAKQLVTG